MMRELSIAEIESKVILLKLLSGGIACGIIFFSFINAIELVGYWMTVVAEIYLIIFCSIILISELSPFIFENYILRILPFLQLHSGRGVFYMILGTFCIDITMGFYVYCLGIALIICGMLYVLAFFLIERKMNITMPTVRSTQENAASIKTPDL